MLVRSRAKWPILLCSICSIWSGGPAMAHADVLPGPAEMGVYGAVSAALSAVLVLGAALGAYLLLRWRRGEAAGPPPWRDPRRRRWLLGAMAAIFVLLSLGIAHEIREQPRRRYHRPGPPPILDPASRRDAPPPSF